MCRARWNVSILKVKNCKYSHDDNALVYCDPHYEHKLTNNKKKTKITVKVTLFFSSLAFIIPELFKALLEELYCEETKNRESETKVSAEFVMYCISY